MMSLTVTYSQFFSQLGFEVGSPEHQILVDAVNYYVDRNIPSVSDFSQYSNKTAVIIGYSFGLGLNNTPGSTNVALATIIKAIFQENQNLPIFVQWEIADALQSIGVTANFKATPKDSYLNTEGVWEQFIKELRRRNMETRTLIVVAHPDHFFRCKQLMEKQDFDVVLPTYSLKPPQPWSSFGCDEWGYDPHSKQDWTTSRPKFLLKELGSLLRTV